MDSGFPIHHGEGGLRRHMLYALGLIAAIAVLAILVVVGFVLPSIACGCTTPPDLIVVNRSHEAVTVDWQTGGLLGTPVLASNGSVRADACTVSDWGLASGDVNATVTVGSSTRTIGFAVGRGSERHPTFLLVDPRGSIGKVLADWPPGTDQTTSCP